jgi:hypothetical protein
MPKLIKLPVFINNTGKINVIEKNLQFEIKRVYFIYDIKDSRGKHAHIKNKQAVISLQGSCSVKVKKNNKENIYILDSNDKLLILEPEDWHEIYNCSSNLIVLVLASEFYDSNDYLN